MWGIPKRTCHGSPFVYELLRVPCFLFSPLSRSHSSSTRWAAEPGPAGPACPTPAPATLHPTPQGCMGQCSPMPHPEPQCKELKVLCWLWEEKLQLCSPESQVVFPAWPTGPAVTWAALGPTFPQLRKESTAASHSTLPTRQGPQEPSASTCGIGL